jgi:hypothetical protein
VFIYYLFILIFFLAFHISVFCSSLQPLLSSRHFIQFELIEKGEEVEEMRKSDGKYKEKQGEDGKALV